MTISLTRKPATSDSAGEVESSYEQLDPSGSGDISASQPVVKISRVDKQITLSFPSLAHASLSTVTTASGFIPEQYRPADQMINLYFFNATQIGEVTIQTDGQIRWIYRDYTGTVSARTNTASGSISWII